MAQVGYRDSYADIMQIVTAKLNDPTIQTQCYFAEVTKVEGIYVDCALKTGEENLQPFTQIPILQTKYFSPITQVGDCGIMLNIKLNIAGLLEDKSVDRRLSAEDYFVFLPLVKSADLQSDFNNLTITSADLKSKIELTNESYTTQHEGDIILEAKKSYSINIKEDIKLEGGAGYAATIKEDYKIESNGVIDLLSKDPLKAGTNTGTLKACFDEIFSCMDALKGSAMVVGQATLSWLPQYDAAKSKAQQLISKIVG